MAEEVIVRLQATTNTPIDAEGSSLSFEVGNVDVLVDSSDTDDFTRSITAWVSRTAPDEVLSLLDTHRAYAERCATIAARSRVESPGTGSPMIRLSVEDVRAIEGMASPAGELGPFFEEATRELIAAASRVTQILRWLFNLMSPGPALLAPQFTWSYERRVWWPVSHGHEDPLPFGKLDVVIKAEGVRVIQHVLDTEGVVVPLGRQLLYEAAELFKAYSLRAALVSAVAAAEVGVKDFAGAHAPERAWLLSELHSPPVVKIIREYLPILTDRRTLDGHVIPRPIIATLQRAVEYRNGVVHRGLDYNDEKELAELLESVNDLLYALDWLGGQEWAFSRLRKQTQAAWGPASSG